MEEAGRDDHVQYEVGGSKHKEEVGVAVGLTKDVDVPEKVLEKTNEENGANDGLKQDQLQQQQKQQPAASPQQQR